MYLLSNEIHVYDHKSSKLIFYDLIKLKLKKRQYYKTKNSLDKCRTRGKSSKEIHTLSLEKYMEI